MLSLETEKAERLTFDVKHWKKSSTDLSKSVCDLEKGRDELKESMDQMQGKLSKQILTLQMEIKELKSNASPSYSFSVGPPTKEMLANRFVESSGHSDETEKGPLRRGTSNVTNKQDLQDSSVPAKITHGKLQRRSTDSSDETNSVRSSHSRSLVDSLKRSILQSSGHSDDDTEKMQISESKGPLRRGTLVTSNVTNKQDLQDSFVPAKITHGKLQRRPTDSSDESNYYSVRSSHSRSLVDSLKMSLMRSMDTTTTAPLDFSNRDSMRPSSRQMNLIESLEQSIRSDCEIMQDPALTSSIFSADGKTLLNSALEQILSDVLADRDRLAHENEQLKGGRPASPSSTMMDTSSNVSVSASLPGRLPSEPPLVSGKSKPSTGRTQIYQLSCRDGSSDIQFVGKTRKELKKTILNHYEDIWKSVKKENAKADGAASSEQQDSEFANSPFGKHFARHCRNAESRDDVMEWCKQNIRVETQTIHDEKNDEGETMPTRTVYQLSCKCCPKVSVCDHCLYIRMYFL